MITYYQLYEILHGDVRLSSITNPYMQGRTLRVMAGNKIWCRHYLAAFSLDEFLKGTADLDNLMALARNFLPSSGEECATDFDEAIALSWCNFQLLKNLFECRSDCLGDFKCISKFNRFQFYALLALHEVSIAYKVLCIAGSHEEYPELSNANCIAALSSTLAANEILNYSYQAIYHELSSLKIESLSEEILRDKKGKSSGGEKTRYEGLRTRFAEEAKRKWDEQKRIGESPYKKKGMCKHLIDFFRDELPLENNRRVEPDNGTIWDTWIPKEIKPDGAMNKKHGLTS